MKNMIVEMGNIRDFESVIAKIAENLPTLPNGWASSVEEGFWEKLFPVSNYRDGRPYCIKVYNVENNKSLYELLLDLHNCGWLPGKGGFIHIWSDGFQWRVAPLGIELLKVKVHRYAPNKVTKYDLLASVELFAHKKLTFKEIYGGSYDPLVRL